MANDNHDSHDAPTGLPAGWVWATIDEISEDVYRYPTFYGMEHLDRGVPVIRGEHINADGTISHDWDDYWYVTPDLSKKYPRTILKPNDLVMSVRGSVGKLGLIDEALRDAQLSPNCIKISPNAELSSSKYLLYFLKSSSGQRAIKDNVNATTIQTIKASLLVQVSIPLPSLPEQHRIVAKIEEQFTRLDAGSAALKRAQANLKRYKAAVLKAACEGKLVEQDASDEPASKLLARILAERRVTNARGRGESRIAATDDLPELPQGWCWAKLDDIATKITDGEHIRPNTVADGIYFLSAKDVREDAVSFDDPLFVTGEDAEKYRRRCDPERNDILVVSRGATVGRTCLIKTDKVFCLLGSVILIKPDKHLISDFLSYALKSPEIQRFLTSLSGSTAQQAIYIRDIRWTDIPLPPLAEQRRIVTEVERRLSVVQELEATLAANLARAERLRQSILKRAFEGKLV